MQACFFIIYFTFIIIILYMLVFIWGEGGWKPWILNCDKCCKFLFLSHQKETCRKCFKFNWLQNILFLGLILDFKNFRKKVLRPNRGQYFTWKLYYWIWGNNAIPSGKSFRVYFPQYLYSVQYRGTWTFVKRLLTAPPTSCHKLINCAKYF